MASICRRLAVVISQAPGLSGTPLFGHSASATSSASCASSSARSMLRVRRARPAMSLARSMRKVASIARCASLAVIPPCRRKPARGQAARAQRSGDAELAALAGARIGELFGGHEGAKVLGLVERTELDLTRAGARGARRPGHRLVHVLDLPDRKAGDELAGLGEGSIDHGALAAFENDALRFTAGLEAGGRNEDAGLDQFLGEIVHRLERRQHFRGRLHRVVDFFAPLEKHHHTHLQSPWLTGLSFDLVQERRTEVLEKDTPRDFFQRWRRERFLRHSGALTPHLSQEIEMKSRAAVAFAAGQPLDIVDVDLDGPKAG